MKRVVLLSSLMLIPIGLFLAAWQAFGYYQLQLEVEALERQQQELVEVNRRLVAEYAFATSPGVVERRAAAELGMAWPRQDQLIALRVQPKAAQP
jgi:cell division protein FtsB